MTPLLALRLSTRAAVVLVVVLCLALHALTLTRFPAIWLDEAIFSDPALNLLASGRLVSSAWYFQDDQAFWAANVPLYPVLLAGWSSWLGASPAGLRSFNLLLAAAATLLLLAAVRRAGWLKSTRWTCWFAALLLCGYGMVLAHRGARYDALGLSLCALALWATGLPPLRRRALLLGTAVVIPWAGLHVAVYAALMAIGWLAWTRAGAWREVAVVLLGLALGLASLGAFLAYQDALDAFLLNVRLSGYAGKKDGPRDPSLLLLLLALAVIAVSATGRQALRRSPVAAGFVAAAIVVPSLIFMAARFPVYYAWMAVVPLALGLAIVVDSFEPVFQASRARRVAALCMGGALLAGLPLQTLITLPLWQQRDTAAIEAFAERAGIQGKVVLADPELFYPARRLASKVYFSMYDFELTARSRLQRADVTMMLVAPDSQAALALQLGGRWQAGEVFLTELPSGYGWLARRVSHSLFGGYRLQVFRRLPAVPPAASLTAAGA